MTTATQVIQAARFEVGTTEQPAGSNCNPYAPEAGLTNCTYWCAAGTSAILIRCKVPVPPGVLTLSTRANAAAWKKASRWVEPADILPGDVMFEHVSGRNGPWPSIDHTGFATAPGGTTSIEFNTSMMVGP